MFFLNQSWQQPLYLYSAKQPAMIVPELELGKRNLLWVPGKSKNPASPISCGTGFKILVDFLWTYRVANGRRSIIPHMQLANACWCKLEQEEASSSVRTKCRLNHHQRQSQPSTWAIQEALPKKNGPPYKGTPNNMQGPQREGSTAYDISSLQEQISHLRQKVQMAKALTSLKLNIGPPSIT